MDERQAIQFILEELKEQRRQDFDMYFEMRKQNTATYERFLDRLRDIDERDAKEVAPVIVERVQPRHEFVTPAEMRIDRIAVAEPKKVRTLVDEDKVVGAIEEFLYRNPHPVSLKPIKEAMEEKFDTKWANFNNVITRASQTSPHIQVDRSSKKYLYWYQE